MAEYPCVVPGCDKVFKTAQQRKLHLVSYLSEEELIDMVLKKADKEPDMIEAEVIT